MVKPGTMNWTWRHVKSKFDEIYEIVKLIPYGKVSTYGAIAEYLGSKRSARLVGWAMNQAHDKPEIPAHRVVNRVGLLSGKNHFGSPTLMQELLEEEGVIIKDDQIVGFNDKFWNPNIELL